MAALNFKKYEVQMRVSARRLEDTLISSKENNLFLSPWKSNYQTIVQNKETSLSAKIQCINSNFIYPKLAWKCAKNFKQIMREKLQRQRSW